MRPSAQGNAAIWTIQYHDQGPDAPDGWCHYPTKTIAIRRGLTPAKQRAVLAHEIVHALRGPCADDPDEITREERTVCRITAETLIPLAAIAAAERELRWTTPHTLAERLRVDALTVRARLRTLSIVERRRLTWCSRRHRPSA